MPAKDYNNYMNTYMKRRYADRMAEAKNILGGCCMICGTTEYLEIDHIDWVYKTLAINKLWSVRYELFLLELQKCQLLCHPHHRQKTKADIMEQRARHASLV